MSGKRGRQRRERGAADGDEREETGRRCRREAPEKEEGSGRPMAKLSIGRESGVTDGAEEDGTGGRATTFE